VGRSRSSCIRTARSFRATTSSAPCRPDRRRSASGCSRPTPTRTRCSATTRSHSSGTSFDDSQRLVAAAEPVISDLLASQNLIYLYSTPWPPQGLYTKKEVASVADLEGLKFRAYNSATARLAEIAEMQPVQIEAAELSQALATGVAESFISSGSTGYDEKVWEHLTHFYTVDAWLPRNTVFANKDAWDGLTEEARAAMLTCAGAAAEEGLAKAKDLTNFYLDGLREGGMAVEPPGDQLRGDLQAIGETMTAEWLEATGEPGQQLVETYRTGN
jgi:TRAP-type C4-dicarboxylate transport system substrate-binding protein